jgi:hypothetical protein
MLVNRNVWLGLTLLATGGPAVAAATGAGDCADVCLILNKVGLYGSDGKLAGKGSDLCAGRKVDEKACR